jgi:hypothetical protein
VAKPPKLYSPHVLVIVLQTSNYCTWEQNNSRSLSSVLVEPRIIHFIFLSRTHYRSHCSITTIYTIIQICYIRVNGGSLTNHKFANQIFKLLQTMSFSQLGTRVAWQVPLYNTQTRFTLPKGAQQNLLLLALLLQQGFNKPWVERYSTRLNRRKGKTPRICQITWTKVSL